MKCVDELPQLAPEASKSTNCGKQKSENKMDALQRHLLNAAIKNKKIKENKKGEIYSQWTANHLQQQRLWTKMQK